MPERFAGKNNAIHLRHLDVGNEYGYVAFRFDERIERIGGSCERRNHEALGLQNGPDIATHLPIIVDDKCNAPGTSGFREGWTESIHIWKTQ